LLNIIREVKEMEKTIMEKIIRKDNYNV